MKLMQLTITEPIRDENQLIKKWSSREVLFNPKVIESVVYIEAIDRPQLNLLSGAKVPVGQTLAEVQRRFEEATT